MKKYVFLIAVSLFCMSFLPQGTMMKTSLVITVLDDLGAIQEGAEVKLFETEADYAELKNAIGPEFTNDKGKVRFTDLKGIDYYVQIKKDNKTNLFGGEKTGKLEDSKYNKVNVIISE